MPYFSDHHTELLSFAARLVVEEGMSYAQAKQKALQQLDLSTRTPLPSNDALEDAVMEHIALFCSDTQPAELRLLRQIALKWMRLLERFSPYLSGAIWHGSATRHSDIHLQLFCDDSKATEIYLIDHHIHYSAAEVKGIHRKNVYTLCASETIPQWHQQALIFMSLYDSNDDHYGALKLDSKGRPPRGNIQAVSKLLATS